MPTETKQPGVFCKGSLILGVAAATWLAWYCVANAGPGSVSESMAQQPHSAAAARAQLQKADPQAPAPDALRARLERLPEGEMKAFYVRCSQEGIERRLYGGEAMACSVGYDVLLQKHFAGDFHRLLDWSRSRSAPQTP